MTATAIPRTVTVAASPRDMPVFAITKRTGYSNTSPRKMPTKTIRNVSPIAQKAASTPIAAATSRIVRMGSVNATRRAPPVSMTREATLWVGGIDGGTDAVLVHAELHPLRGVNGRSSSAPGWTIPTWDSGTSFQAPGRSPRGSETTTLVSSDSPASSSLSG